MRNERFVYILLLFFCSSSYGIVLNKDHLKPFIDELSSSSSPGMEYNCHRDFTPEQNEFKLYIAEPDKRKEKWRDRYKLPKLLKADFYKKSDVCKDAQMRKSGSKRYALIVIKSHLCDAGGKVCMNTLKTISDLENSFLQDNFVIYHARTYSGRNQLNGANEIMEEYGRLGPSVAIIDLKNCKALKAKNGEQSVHPFSGKKIHEGSQEINIWAHNNPNIRNNDMQKNLLTSFPDLAIDGSKFRSHVRTDLKFQTKISYGPYETNFLQGLRKMMDEQYLDIVGRRAYEEGPGQRRRR